MLLNKISIDVELLSMVFDKILNGEMIILVYTTNIIFGQFCYIQRKLLKLKYREKIIKNI